MQDRAARFALHRDWVKNRVVMYGDRYVEGTRVINERSM